MPETLNENQYIINRKSIIVARGLNQRRLAAAVGCTPAAIQQNISGNGTTYRLHRKIADHLHVSMVSFWPELYDNLAQLNQFGDEQKAVVNQ